MRRKHVFILSIILLSLFWPDLLLAQDSVDVVVDEVEAVEMRDHMLLRVYFTLAGDGLGEETAVSEAVVQLEDGSIYPVSLEKPPFYVALVLDTSSSMAPVFDQVQQAAIELVESSPEEVQFAVIEFDDNISLLQPYTSNQSQIINAINRLQADESGSCLYDVTYAAAQSLDQISQDTPNRAMVLFTDSQGVVGDETCHQYTKEDITTFTANRNQSLPIYAIGIAQRESDLDTELLTQLAQATGGSFINGTAGEISEQRQQILSDIGRHWVAEAEVLPNAGIQRGSLLLRLGDGGLPAPGPLVFQSSTDYRESQTPVEQTVHISNFRYDELTNSFIFDTSLINLDDAAQLLAEAIDEESNVQVDLVLIQNPSPLQQIRLDTDNMVTNHRYAVEVVLRNANGDLITDEEGLPITDDYNFQYSPPQPFNLDIESVVIENEPARFNFESFQLEDDEVNLMIAYRTSGEGKATVLNGRLLNQATNQRTEAFTLEIVEPGMAQSPIQAESGNYTLVVTALDESGDLLNSASHSFTITSPDNAVMRSGKAVQSNPLLLFFFTIMGTGIAFLGWRLGHNLGYRTAYRSLPAGLNLTARSEEEEAEEEDTPQLAVLTLVGSPDESLTEINRWEITEYPFTIGREDCDITISKDRHVSRKHAQIIFENNEYFIEDLASSNGTFVNDTQITAREPMPLRRDKGTRIQIGKTTSFLFKVEMDENRESERDT